eukprot:2085-Eustigmatos_ZCMA.PRE.1
MAVVVVILSSVTIGSSTVACSMRTTANECEDIRSLSASSAALNPVAWSTTPHTLHPLISGWF